MKIYLDYLKDCKVLEMHPEGFIDLDEISTGSIDAKIKYIESNYLSKNARVAFIDGKYQVVPSGKVCNGYVTVAFKHKDDDRSKLHLNIKLSKSIESNLFGPVSEVEAIHAEVTLTGKELIDSKDFINIDLGDLICDDLRNWVYDHGFTEYNSVINFDVILTDTVANSTTFRVGIDPIDIEEAEETRHMNSESLKCLVIRYLTSTFKCGTVNAEIVVDNRNVDEDTGLIKYDEGKDPDIYPPKPLPEDAEGNIISLEDKIKISNLTDVPNIDKADICIMTFDLNNLRVIHEPKKSLIIKCVINHTRLIIDYKNMKVTLELPTKNLVWEFNAEDFNKFEYDFKMKFIYAFDDTYKLSDESLLNCVKTMKLYKYYKKLSATKFEVNVLKNSSGVPVVNTIDPSAGQYISLDYLATFLFIDRLSIGDLI